MVKNRKDIQTRSQLELELASYSLWTLELASYSLWTLELASYSLWTLELGRLGERPTRKEPLA